jgi:hypothetical protein
MRAIKKVEDEEKKKENGKIKITVKMKVQCRSVREKKRVGERRRGRKKGRTM